MNHGEEPLALDDADEALIQAAADVLKRNYHPVRHSVGCTVRCGSGRVYTGVNVEACAYGPCAEPIAIGSAISQGERELVAIVALCKNSSSEEFVVLSPCGNCRQLILDYASDCMVIFCLGDSVLKSSARFLLPGAYESCFD